MSNILIRGCPGTGKTFLARAAAYYMCMHGLNEGDAFKQNPSLDLCAIEQFVDDGKRCEFIQVHPSMEFDDIVYGLSVSANGTFNIAFAEKRIMALCDRARGKKEKYCIILDDIDRANASNLLGNLLYAMEYRNQDIELPDGKTMNIPDNVTLIFTENTLNVNNGLDLAVRRRMTYLKELKSSKDVIRTHYRGVLTSDALHLVLDIYDRVQDFIISYFENEPGLVPTQYVPGHGMFIVECVGNAHYIMDNIRQKIRFQIVPYLKDLYAMGLLRADPEAFIEQINTTINSGIEGLCPIASIKKKLIKKNVIMDSFSLTDSRNYYYDTIVPAKCKDFRGMMECIIDALILNGVFPSDVLFGSLLQNTSIAYIESLHAPYDKAAYMVEKSKANRFMYETVRGDRISGTHAYFTLDSAVTGRYSSENDTEEYVVSYNDGRQDTEYIPLSGFRNHGFNPESPELGVKHNTVNIMSAVHILLSNYYALYQSNMALIMGEETEYHDLYKLIKLEYRYLELIKQMLRGHSPDAPKGDENRLAYYGDKIKNLRLLWNGVGDGIDIDKDKFESLVTGNVELTLDSYEDLFNYTIATKKTIWIKGVLKMVDLKDYQKIMENIGIRQMIFQGPPGTSKTYESKRFVLTQLNPAAPSLSKEFASQEDISNDLEAFKLTDADYADPKTSSKLITGGWDLVQFHPSYGYEDFIRGIEVKIPHGATTPSYESVNRILGKIADFAKAAAKQDAENQPKFYLIVDEINRANLATVFGELIYGLEYRNSKVSTPYEVTEKSTGTLTKDIVLGKNLFILGTMNTADKSIDAIDYAIRRRFIFIDSPADRNVVLNCYQNVSGNEDENSIELLLFDAVQHIFNDDRFFNNEYQKSDVRIGHTYFLRDRKRGYEDAIVEHFLFQVVPILREYVKDGILDVTENLVPLEHTPSEIKSAESGEEQIDLLCENLMLYVNDFGNLNKSNVVIDNDYIGKFIDDLRKEFGY